MKNYFIKLLKDLTLNKFSHQWCNDVYDTVFSIDKTSIHLELNRKYTNNELSELLPGISPKARIIKIKDYCLANGFEFIKNNSGGERSIILKKQYGSINF